jgi:hypothetical protein
MNTINTCELITKLLYHHTCVVVPNFGAFVCTFHPAKLAPEKGQILPPRKAISFNASIKSDDGLLTNALGLRYRITYQEAANKLQAEVNNWQLALKAGEQLELGTLGVFWLNQERRLQFRAKDTSLFIGNSFGLQSVKLPSISALKTVVTEEAISEPETKIIPLSNGKSNTWKWAAAAAMLPFALYFSTRNIELENIQVSSILPFFTEEQVYAERSVLPEFAEITEEEILAENTDLKENQRYVADYTFGDPPIALKNNNFDVASLHQYQVIAGCFGSIQNAEKFISKLESKGYSASLISYEKGLFRVSIQGYSSKKSAVSYIRKHKKSPLLKGLWVMQVKG